MVLLVKRRHLFSSQFTSSTPVKMMNHTVAKTSPWPCKSTCTLTVNCCRSLQRQHGYSTTSSLAEAVVTAEHTIEHANHHQPTNTPNSSATTFYRRPLPSNLHSFTSSHGKQLFKEALLSGLAENYFQLSGNYTMQSEPAFCGLGSLAMILNSLSVDPGRRWKGVWRWFADDMLECARTENIKIHGLTFREFAALARCNGLDVEERRADQVSRETFIQDVKEVCASTDRHIVVSFSRQALCQSGNGHFSPIAAFHAEKGQVLVLDVARFKYPSYFCDINLLYDAMKPVDSMTNLPRGYFILSKNENATSLGLVRLLSDPEVEWHALNHLLCKSIPEIFYTLTSSQPEFSKDQLGLGILSILSTLPLIPITFEKAGIDLAGPRNDIPRLHDQAVHSLLHEVEQTELYRLLHRCSFSLPPVLSGIDKLMQSDSNYLTYCTILLLSAPTDMLSSIPARYSSLFRVDSSRHTKLLLETRKLSRQLDCMFQSHCQCKS